MIDTHYFDDRILGMDVDANGNCVVTGTYWEGSGINIGAVNITGSAFGSLPGSLLKFAGKRFRTQLQF